MGIKNFGTIIKHANQYGSSTPCTRTATYSEFAGQTWVIDASIFCYRFSYNPKSKRPCPCLDGFYQLFHRLIKNKIKPILVFDGDAPQEKLGALQARTQVTQHSQDRIDQLINRLFGCDRPAFD